MTTRQIRPDWQEHYGTEYIAIGPFCWGRGETREKALAAARKEYGRKWRGVPFTIYLVPKGAEVTEMGGFRFPADADIVEVETVPKLSLKKKLERRAVPAAEVPGVAERRQRLLDAEKKCEHLTTNLCTRYGPTRVTFFIDEATWRTFIECCTLAGADPDEVLRNAVVRETRANIMARAEKGDK